MKMIHFIRKILPVVALLAAFRCYAQLSGIVNVYTPVISMNSCNPEITVGSTAGLAPGDKVLIIKMRGAHVSPGSADGKVGLINDVGMSEYGFIQSISGNKVTLKHYPVNNYGSPTYGNVQMIRVATGDVLTTTGTVTAPPWDGEKGGVVVINCCRLTLSHSITVDGCGFRGGKYYSSPASSSPVLVRVSTSKHYRYNSDWAGNKGEGVGSSTAWGTVGDLYGAGHIAWGNGGGGGNNHNAGGGGGGNAGFGGRGGNIYSGAMPNTSYFGKGGHAIGPGLYMGGGGGAGHANDNRGSSAGGNGGGIIIIECSTALINNGGLLSANGNSPTTPGLDDGMGGGGAGGTISVYSKAYTGNPSIFCFVNGGHGGSVTANWASTGPGGGGSDGTIFYSAALNGRINSGITTNSAGTDARSGTTWGATNGGGKLTVAGHRQIKQGYIPVVAPFPDKEFTICEEGTIRICDTIPLYAERSTWSGFNNSFTYSIPLDPPVVTNPPVCNPPEPVYQRRTICRTYSNIKETGNITVVYRLTNGCEITRIFRVNVTKAPVRTVKLDVSCGTTINLNQYASLCDPSTSSTGWLDSNNSRAALSPVTPNSSRVYIRKFYTGPSYARCLSCVLRVEVNVRQFAPLVKTVLGCEGQLVDMYSGTNWPAGSTFRWRSPLGPIPYTTPGIRVYAFNGQVYRCDVTYPNGCVQAVEIHVSTLVPQSRSRIITVECGDSINLDDYDDCGNPLFSWRDVGTGLTVSNKVLITANRNFSRQTFAIVGSTICPTCTMNLTVNVVPKSPIVKTVLGCSGAPLYIESNCNASSYQWINPQGFVMPNNSKGITVTAQAGDVWRSVSTLPNGCACTTDVTIVTSPVPEYYDTLTVYCGDSINLDTLKKCTGGASAGWYYINGGGITNSKIAPGTGTHNYYHQVYTDATFNCINCKHLLTVNVLPRVADTVILAGCTGQTLTLTPPCEVQGTRYVLTGPTGSNTFFPPGPVTASVTVAAAQTTYTFETTLGNQCVCRRVYIINSLSVNPVTDTVNINVLCGAYINLDSFSRCPGGNVVWQNAAGTDIAPAVKITGQNTLTFFGRSTGANGCVQCITVVNVNPTVAPASSKSYVMNCNADGISIGPDCQGDIYEWTDLQTGDVTIFHGGNGSRGVPPFSGTRNFSVRTITSDSCVCITDITVNSNIVPASNYHFIANLNCGDVLDLNSYNQCDAAGAANWEEYPSGAVVSTSIPAAYSNQSRTFYKEVYDANGCLLCRVSVTLQVQGNYTIYELERQDVCVGSKIDPPSACPGADHYEWYYYDANVNLKLAGTDQGLTAVAGMGEMYYRYNYDANGCLLCVESMLVVSHDPLSPEDISAITPVSVTTLIDCDHPFYCKDESAGSGYRYDFGPQVNCSWNPANMHDGAQGHLLICPPYTPGIYERICQTADGCVISAFKVQLDTLCVRTELGKTGGNKMQPKGTQISQEYTIYPNPAQDKFNVERNVTTEGVKVFMYNAVGQLITVNEMAEGENRTEFNLSGFSKGLYLVKIVDSTGDVTTLRLLHH